MRRGVGKTPGGYTWVVGCEGERNNTEGEQTTKFAACVVDCLMSTTRLVGLLIVHGRARCPSRGIGDHHTTRVRGPLGLWF